LRDDGGKSLSVVFSRALLDNAFTMVDDGRGTVRQDGDEVAHEADKDLVRDAIVHADPGDLKALKNIHGCVFLRRFAIIVVSRHGVSSLHLYSCEALQTFMYIHSPVEFDPNSINLDCSAKVNNIILRRV